MSQVLICRLEVLDYKYFLKNINKKVNLVELESALVRESSFFIILVVKALNSLFRGPGFKTTGWLHNRLPFHDLLQKICFIKIIFLIFLPDLNYRDL